MVLDWGFGPRMLRTVPFAQLRAIVVFVGAECPFASVFLSLRTRRVISLAVLTRFLVLIIGLIAGTARAQAQTPTVGAVVNGASYSAGPISPGMMVVLFGENLGPDELTTLQLDSDGGVATALGGVRVLFDDVPAPLIYVSRTQASAMVPYALQGRTSSQIQVVTSAGSSGAFTKAVAESGPGIFTVDATGKGQGAIVNGDGSLNTAATPARKESAFSVFVTGEGLTDPRGQDGALARGIGNALLPVSMKIGGKTARVLYAGFAPGNVNGFAQINAVAPSDLPYGGSLPLKVEIGGIPSQTGVTIAVEGPPAPLLGAPLNLVAIVSNSGQVDLTWTLVDSLGSRTLVERRSGQSGQFIEIQSVQSGITAYTDASVAAGTTYQYRVRTENDYGWSSYSAAVTVMVTPPVVAPPAPVLQATALSASAIRLSWTSGASGIVRHRLERRILPNTVFIETAQLSADSSTYVDVALTSATRYAYRLRTETAAGLSPYSNEAAATSQGLPAPPTNLRGTATSSTEASLTWTNNAPGASAIRVESRPAGAAGFTDIGTAFTLTSTGVIGLAPGTSYTFRVRAQNAAGYSAYSNEASLATLSPKTTVFLIHGLRQGPADMDRLEGSLKAPGGVGVDLTRFQIDAEFDFSACADNFLCDSTCSISRGAQELAQHIINAKPTGDIIIVGFSLGGLIARDMIAYNHLGVLSQRKVAAFITLGTPNAGYPYIPVDGVASCSFLAEQMKGDWRSEQSRNGVILSPYLASLSSRWASTFYPGNNGVWLAVSGRSCSDPVRSFSFSTGCRDISPYSDGVVCFDSASYNLATPSGTEPNLFWNDPQEMYVHTVGAGSELVLCGNSGGPNALPLSDPPVTGALFKSLKALINAYVP